MFENSKMYQKKNYILYNITKNIWYKFNQNRLNTLGKKQKKKKEQVGVLNCPLIRLISKMRLYSTFAITAEIIGISIILDV